ncbi:MAG: efflux pump, inner rane subunit [Acidobacteria bacterium]|nr:efflux pump, inner rane subunit [Acidobacteriota bacterium]
MPEWQEEIRHRLAGLNLAPEREGEIVEELSQHLEDRYEDLLALGNAPEAAFHIALAELSESDLLVSELGRIERRVGPEPIIIGTNRSTNMIAGLWQDLRHGTRALLKNPGFTALVVLTLALGIGANVALFSVVNGVLLNPLPFPQPDQLVTLDQSKPNFDRGAIPYPNFRDLQKENRTFSAMAISRGFSFSLLGTGEAERVSARLISADFFSVLDVKPALGRTLAPGEDEPGAGPVVLISAELWQRKFGAAQDVLGKSLTLDDGTYTIVGVIPANFSLFRGTDVYVPIGQWKNPALKTRSAALALHGIGRLKPGVSIEQAQADLNGVMGRLAATYPDTNRGNGAKVSSLKERMIGGIGPTLWMLLGAVGFVLLIACVNVNNLLLARSTGRTREFAIRAALGAGQWRLLRQSLTESLLLALAGGALGLVVAGWGMQAALSVLPTTLPRAAEVGLDSRVLIFTVLISLFTGIISGLAPALKTSRWRLSETLKEGGRGASSRSRAQGALVAVEMALAVVLLIGAGLMIRSLSALWNVDPGFRSDSVLTFSLSLSPAMNAAGPGATRAALRELSDRISSTPGVRAASFSAGAVPLQGEDDLFFWIDGQPKPVSQSEMNMALVYRVEPGYLTAMGIPLKQGRFFSNQDDERSQQVVVIDEVFARKYFGDSNPVGKRIRQDGQDPQQIVGVVGHVKQWSIDSDDSQSLQAQLYEPFRQLSDNSLPTGAGVVALYNGPAAPLDSIRRVVQNHNKQNVISRPHTMTEVIADTLADRRFSMILLEAFALVALLLASLGLYGVISYLVGQRTHELGIRLALGAQRRDVLRLILNHGMKMALGGMALGLIAALGLTRLLTKMIYGVSTTDPATFVIVSLLLTTVALLACFIPALRATKVDPLVALRYE